MMAETRLEIRMDRERTKTILMDIARRLCFVGPGYAQEGSVMREARQSFQRASLAEEQMILDCWHELFREGKLAWGYDLENPGHPFFHVATELLTAR